MPRPKKIRKLDNPPKMIGFKPFGLKNTKITSIKLSLEGYESIKLVNYELLSQEEAALKMNVSRPTFTRIYNKALKLIAQAFVEGKSIIIEGGNYEFHAEWFRCRKCYKLIEGLDNHKKCDNCTSYNPNELIPI